MIPKSIYFYYGGEYLPYLQYMTLSSFKRYNPDWEITLYVPMKLCLSKTWKTHPQKYEIIDKKNYFDKLEELNIKIKVFDMEDIGFSNDIPEVIKSDILRLHLLSTNGGIWSDIDIFYIKSINYVIDFDCDGYVCYCNGSGDYYSIGLLISSINNSLYKKIYNNVRKKINFSKYQSVGSPMYKKIIGFNENEINTKYNMKNLEMSIVYPIRDFSMLHEKEYQESLQYIKENTVGIHWYAGNSLSNEFYKGTKNILYYFDKIMKDEEI